MPLVARSINIEDSGKRQTDLVSQEMVMATIRYQVGEENPLSTSHFNITLSKSASQLGLIICYFGGCYCHV